MKYQEKKRRKEIGFNVKLERTIILVCISSKLKSQFTLISIQHNLKLCFSETRSLRDKIVLSLDVILVKHNLKLKPRLEREYGPLLCLKI